MSVEQTVGGVARERFRPHGAGGDRRETEVFATHNSAGHKHGLGLACERRWVVTLLKTEFQQHLLIPRL